MKSCLIHQVSLSDGGTKHTDYLIFGTVKSEIASESSGNS